MKGVRYGSDALGLKFWGLRIGRREFRVGWFAKPWTWRVRWFVGLDPDGRGPVAWVQARRVWLSTHPIGNGGTS